MFQLSYWISSSSFLNLESFAIPRNVCKVVGWSETTSTVADREGRASGRDEVHQAWVLVNVTEAMAPHPMPQVILIELFPSLFVRLINPAIAFNLNPKNATSTRALQVKCIIRVGKVIRQKPNRKPLEGATTCFKYRLIDTKEHCRYVESLATQLALPVLDIAPIDESDNTGSHVLEVSSITVITGTSHYRSAESGGQSRCTLNWDYANHRLNRR